MKKIFLLLLGLLLFGNAAKADEGMWLPSLIGDRIKDMRSKGFKLSAEDVYSINKASLKDGIVLFGRGCTGELVSNEGLLLTNHHCGFGEIQSHSSVEHDYLANGFWAMNQMEELPNPGLEVAFLVRMEDVTEQVNDGVSATASEEDRNKRQSQNIKRIVAEATAGNHYRASVEAFYYGNQYFLFVNEVFTDVRLVGAPPSSIGSFGGDTDNWMWPRHTGDFSIFRIYAGKDNKPAPYSPDNVPYQPKKFFTVSTKGVQEGDFTMVYGFPGTTRQFLISDEVDYVLNFSNPAKIKLRTMRLDVIKAAREKDPAIRIAYAAKQSGIANAWKKWQGESLGLRRLGTVAKKQRYEDRFVIWANSNPEYATVVPDLHREYAELKPYAMALDYYNEAILAMELTRAARFVLAAAETDKNETLPNEATWGVPENVKTFYKDYYPEIDRTIAKLLLAEYLRETSDQFIPASVARDVERMGGVSGYIDHIFDNTALVSESTVTEAFADRKKLKDIIDNDPGVSFFVEFKKMFDTRIRGEYVTRNRNINELYRTYTRGQMAFEDAVPTGRAFFPDANLTLRVAYGHVGGYEPEDAVVHLPASTIEGIMEKDNPEIYDYNIPQRLRDLYASEDYGRWGVNGTLPVCFIATNHTTGGNSGSPILNARGELVGINFDRTWLSTMSDIEFDPYICRNISVDIRYVLFVIDKIGGAGYLIDEMRLK